MIRIIEPLKPGQSLHARIKLPGSKSVTHRALMMAALADGPCRIDNPLRAEDTELTANALTQVGATITWAAESVRVTPPNTRWHSPTAPIQLGNSGTTTRLLAALLAAGRGRFVLDGSDRLRQRPLAPLLNALAGQSVRVRHLQAPGYLPLEMVSEGLTGGSVQIDAGASSQYLSALLMSAPAAAADLTVGWTLPVASFPYVLITLAMMEEFGIHYRRLAENAILVPAPQTYRAFSHEVEGDCSSASYFWAAAAITGGEVFTGPVKPGALQGDCRLLEALEQMGCRVDWRERGVRVRGPARLGALDLDLNQMPDMVPTLAVVAAFADGTSRIRNVAHLRIKECDRLSALAGELVKTGALIDELPDGLVIRGGPRHGAAIDSHNDHRIAMALALVGLRIAGVEIHGAEAVVKSFPGFWDAFASLAARS